MDFDRLSAFLPFVKSLWKVFSPSIYLPSTQGIVGVEREEDSFLLMNNSSLQKQEHVGRIEHFHCFAVFAQTARHEHSLIDRSSRTTNQQLVIVCEVVQKHKILIWGEYLTTFNKQITSTHCFISSFLSHVSQTAMKTEVVDWWHHEAEGDRGSRVLIVARTTKHLRLKTKISKFDHGAEQWFVVSALLINTPRSCEHMLFSR